ncbi:MAG: tryptophan synthase subunit alpha [Chloroherpetonaceae bacterium]|nr:tryptophan synthase subunit alpha [Chloroherpetonaceae bacterium]MDW8437656.1 tryptophan synthase subunit alpha [Chloroherpetonaceae bacterium]
MTLDVQTHNRVAALCASSAKLLVAYLMPEFPIPNATLPALFALEESGVNVIELGMPHSDPLADGRTIQDAAQLAIKNGATLKRILSLVKTARQQGFNAALILMGYVNPILRYGTTAFLNDAKAVGVDGFIVPDLPPEEAEAFRRDVARRNLSMTFLISPVSSPERIQTIDALSTDFSYALAVNATTGTAKLSSEKIFDELEAYLARVRANVKKKFVVGFGIQTRAQIEWMLERADGAVVGSAYLRAIASAQTPEAVAERTKAFWRTLQA